MSKDYGEPKVVLEWMVDQEIGEPLVNKEGEDSWATKVPKEILER